MLLIAFIGLAALGAATSGPPDSHVEDVGVVQRVESDKTTNPESGRITTWWTKEIVVVDGDRTAWAFSVRDRSEYAPGDEITVYYDPGDPARTLVTADHVFRPGAQLAAVLGIGVVLLFATVLVGVSVAPMLGRLGRAAMRRVGRSG